MNVAETSFASHAFEGSGFERKLEQVAVVNANLWYRYTVCLKVRSNNARALTRCSADLLRLDPASNGVHPPDWLLV
jgi:hypothetical protein